MEYAAIIRTLGTAGAKYQQLLDSLCAQSLRPQRILVYIADGYAIPKETCGHEEYIHVRKGMVAQRALPFSEVNTEYMLFLDDDIYLPPTAVEKMFGLLKCNAADVVAADVFPNNRRSPLSEMLMTVSGRMRARRRDNVYGNQLMCTTGFSYNQNPTKDAYVSQSNSGNCFLCRKEDFLKIRFHEELWLDKMAYAIGDDQVMFYKMHLLGLKQLTYYHSGIEHLDAGNNLGNKDKERQLVENDYYFRRVFYERFLKEPERFALRRVWMRLCITYFFSFGEAVSLLKGDLDMLRRKRTAIRRAKDFINSEEYKSLPKVIAQ